MTVADDLMAQALADPRAALRLGESHLAGLDEAAAQERSEVLRAMSMAARHVGEIDSSISLARLAADTAEAAGFTELRLMGLLTMSGSLAIAGRTEDALVIIDQGLAVADDPHLRARFVFQRGAVLHNVGRLTEALDAYRAALPVFRRFEDGFSVGQTLNRIGSACTALGRPADAEAHLVEALRLAEERGEHAAAHGIQHNLGLLASYRGDIPLALDWLQKSDDLYMETSGATAPQHVARSEVLISAGLFGEALRSARAIADAAAERGDVEHQANALMVAARAAVLSGSHTEADHLAGHAARLFGHVGSAPRAAEATELGLEARYADSGASHQLHAEAEEIATLVAGEGLLMAAVQARFLCARIAEDLDMPDRAREMLEAVANTDSGPVEMRLQAALARARLRLAEGEPGAALRAIRTGLDTIDRYQSALGATDLRMGIERHGAELAETGLGLAVDAGRPRRVLEWLDRTRARSLRHRPVLPTGDHEMQEDMAELRRLIAEMRTPSNRNDPGLLRRRVQLEQKITRSDRLRRGQEEPGSGFSIDGLIDTLGTRALYEIGVRDGKLFAVLAHDRRARVVSLGDADAVRVETSRVRFDMRRAARLGRDLKPSTLRRLDELLLDGVHLRSDDVIVVPPPPLMAVPWAALPSLAGRAVTVAPSAEVWWRASRSAGTESGSILVATGPDLAMAGSEAARIASLYRERAVLATGSKVEAIREAMGRVGTAHIACHAAFSVENPMFSSLRLEDGDLNVYDLERLEAVPSLVVLSACDSGYTETGAGDELAGLTSALLSMGTRTLVASVGLVPDSPATPELMERFHRGLLGGLNPARSLATAQSEFADDPAGFAAAASFICVGAGS